MDNFAHPPETREIPTPIRLLSPAMTSMNIR
jgi:hypothetical protein